MNFKKWVKTPKEIKEYAVKTNKKYFAKRKHGLMIGFMVPIGGIGLVLIERAKGIESVIKWDWVFIWIVSHLIAMGLYYRDGEK